MKNIFDKICLLTSSLCVRRLCILCRLLIAVFVGTSTVSVYINFMYKFCYVLCIAACERWKPTENVHAENGIFYPLTSVTDCMDLCLSKLSCVAIDIWSDVCSLHMNASDLLSNRVTSGVSQFVLDRSCPVSTVSATSLETLSTPSAETTGTMAFFYDGFLMYMYINIEDD